MQPYIPHTCVFVRVDPALELQGSRWTLVTPSDHSFHRRKHVRAEASERHRAKIVPLLESSRRCAAKRSSFIFSHLFDGY